MPEQPLQQAQQLLQQAQQLQYLRPQQHCQQWFLVIIGFILVILVPITIIYFKYTGSTYDIVGGSKAGQIANEIVKSANEVYAFGEGSQKKIKMGFPDGIDNVGFEKREIVFRFKDSIGRISEIVEVSDN